MHFPTEVNTEQPRASGACRRRARAFAPLDRANHQVVGSRTLGCSLHLKNSGRSARAVRHERKTQMIPYR